MTCASTAYCTAYAIINAIITVFRGLAYPISTGQQVASNISIGFSRASVGRRIITLIVTAVKVVFKANVTFFRSRVISSVSAGCARRIIESAVVSSGTFIPEDFVIHAKSKVSAGLQESQESCVSSSKVGRISEIFVINGLIFSFVLRLVKATLRNEDINLFLACGANQRHVNLDLLNRTV